MIGFNKRELSLQ